MAEYVIQGETLGEIADAIREKSGKTYPIQTDSMAEEILAIETKPVLQDKTVDPTTAQQIVQPDTGFDGLAKVTVNAVDTAEQATPSIYVNANGLITASATQAAGYVAAGTKTAQEQLATQPAQTITPGTSDKTISAGKYLTGVQTIKGDSNLVAGNIKKGVSVFGIVGTHESGVIVRRAQGNCEADGNSVATVNLGFKPDIVVFLNSYAAAVCFNEVSTAGNYAEMYLQTIVGDLQKTRIRQTSNGFEICDYYTYSESSNIWVLTGTTIPYVAIKYT